jgi:hypothetical protein
MSVPTKLFVKYGGVVGSISLLGALVAVQFV